MTKQFSARHIIKFFLIMLVLAIACTAAGCNGNSHIDEPEITVEYLQGEYAEQLVRDGAEVILGTISEPMFICDAPTDGTSGSGITNMSFTVNAKEYVKDPNSENGYYIADRNKAYIACGSTDTRIAFDFAGTGTFDIVDIEEFMSQDLSDKLFDVYLINEQALLILEHII